MKMNRIVARHMHIIEQELIMIADAIDFGSDRFYSDPFLRRAVKDCVESIGESAARLLDEGIDETEYQDLPWHKMRGFRNRANHEYDDVNYDVVWNIATTECPPMNARLQTAFVQAVEFREETGEAPYDPGGAIKLPHHGQYIASKKCGAATIDGVACRNPASNCPHHG